MAAGLHSPSTVKEGVTWVITAGMGPKSPVTGRSWMRLQMGLVWGCPKRTALLCRLPSDISPGAPSWLLQAQRDVVDPQPWRSALPPTQPSLKATGSSVRGGQGNLRSLAKDSEGLGSSPQAALGIGANALL